MIYIVGTLGFIAGFVLGQMILLRALRGYSNDELLNNPGLKWRYGLLNWFLAVVTAIAAVWLYNDYFVSP